MCNFFLLIIFNFLVAAFAVPAGRGFFVPTELDTEAFADIPPHCLQIDADMEACYLGIQTTGDIEADTEMVKKCICANDSFSMERVTSCTEDPLAWSDVCGNELKEQEAELGLEVVF